jgi:hypothetical protein
MKAYTFAVVSFRILAIWFLFGSAYHAILGTVPESKHALLDAIFGLVAYGGAPTLAKWAVRNDKE